MTRQETELLREQDLCTGGMMSGSYGSASSMSLHIETCSASARGKTVTQLQSYLETI